MNELETEALRVAIVGGGCSGSLVAAHLLRQDQAVHVDLIDWRLPCHGLAYSTPWDQHLLNVRSARMSAFGSDPDHFLNWLRRNGFPKASPDSFVSRKAFGAYLESVLQDSIRSAAPSYRFRHHGSSAVRIFHDGSRARVLLENGDVLLADRVVLATGNPAPCPFRIDSDRYFNSPWEGSALTGLAKDASVLLLGSGLTAVDAFLALQAQGHEGTIYCLSRRGKVPHVHTVYRSFTETFDHRGIQGALTFVREFRRWVKSAESQGHDWRAAVDSLRPVTNEIWAQFDLREKFRVMRHLKPWWDIHRHRMAPEIGSKVDRALATKRLQVMAGRLGEVIAEAAGLRVSLRLRTQESVTLQIGRVINCTGSEENYQNSTSPLLRFLLEAGRIQCDRSGKGLATTDSGATVDSQGIESGWLYTLGPPKVGGLFETTAVPELRIQAEALAHRLVSTPYVPPKPPVDFYVGAGI